MSQKYSFFAFSLAVIVCIYVLFNFEFRTPILTGFIFSALTYPLYQIGNSLVHKYAIPFVSKQAVAIGVVVLCGFLLYICISYVTTQVIYEINNNAEPILQWLSTSLSNENVVKWGSTVGLKESDINEISSNIVTNIEPYIRSFVNFDNLSRVYDVGTRIMSVIFNQMLYLVIFILAWFNGLVYGSVWIQKIVQLIPIDNAQQHTIMHELKLGIRNVIYANVLSGVINALAVVILMTTLGLPGAFLSGIFAFLIGFLPLTPSELSFAPALFFLIQINPILTLFVAICAEFFVLFLNYVFLPRVVLTGTQGNPLFIITSVLSGIAIFGLMGFIIGPTIMIFVNTFSQITYRNIMSEKKLLTRSL